MALLACLFAAALCFQLLWLDGTGRVLPNVTVGGVSAGGLDRAQLRAALNAWLSRLGATADESWPELRLMFTDVATSREWPSDGYSLGLGIDLEATTERVLDAGRPAPNIASAVADLLRRSVVGLRVDPAIVLDRPALTVLLADIALEVNVAPANASLVPGQGEVRAGRPGRLLDEAATEEALEAAITAAVRGESDPFRDQGDPSIALPPRTPESQPPQNGISLRVDLAFREVAPRGDAARLSALNRDRLGSFSTSFDPTQAGRTWNIALSSARLDGVVIEPGGVISFNDLVGARSREAGFREAPEIVGLELVPGYGGGVCQVATTVCNAVLLADLEVQTRFHHSRPTAYADLGRDATVAYPNLDLTVVNPRAFPVILTVGVDGGELTASVWGRRTLEAEVVLSTEEVERRPAGYLVRIDASLPSGTHDVIRAPFDGRDIRLWREISQQGRVVRRELVWVDHYDPLTGLVGVGPRVDSQIEADAAPVKSPR